MIDNTHVIVAACGGDAMIPVPEMAAFAERFGFRFKAHQEKATDVSDEQRREVADSNDASGASRKSHLPNFRWTR